MIFFNDTAPIAGIHPGTGQLYGKPDSHIHFRRPSEPAYKEKGAKDGFRDYGIVLAFISYMIKSIACIEIRRYLQWQK